MTGLAFQTAALCMVHKTLYQKVGVLKFAQFENRALAKIAIACWINFFGNSLAVKSYSI
jgi:hypothetical protein